mgnify:CR=1 FL=1
MKVLVLSGRFGMGHEMAANAICEQFRKIDEQAEIEMLKDAILICLKKGKVKKEKKIFWKSYIHISVNSFSVDSA